MEIKAFIEKFSMLLEDMNTAELKSETKFRDIEEWSSLMALSIIAMVDEEYNVKIKGDDIRNSQTINDLYCIIKSRL